MCLLYELFTMEVRYGRYRPTWPRGAWEVKAPRFIDTRHIKVARPPLPTGISWYTFLEAEPTPGTWACRMLRKKKCPVIPAGIDTGTFRLVAQRLNHYTIPGAFSKCRRVIISWWGWEPSGHSTEFIPSTCWRSLPQISNSLNSNSLLPERKLLKSSLSSCLQKRNSNTNSGWQPCT